MSDDMTPSLGDLGSLANQIKFILDVQACAKRVDELTGLTALAIEAKAAAERAEASLRARESQFAEAEAEADDRRLKLAEQELHLRGREAAIVAERRELEMRENQLKHRMIRHFGLEKPGPLQSMPSFASIEDEGAQAPDPHFSTSPDHDASSEAPDQDDQPMPAGVTLTRSKPQRRGADRN